jgi:preprotein translocase subunit SecG
MTTSLMILQAIVSVLLIISVLLQFGKGAEAGLMGGAGGESVFTGSQQGNILSKITVVLSIIFLGNSVLLARLQSSGTAKSLLDGEAPISRPLNNDLQGSTAPAAGASDAAAPATTTPTETQKP